jgi:hypothetical protein
LLYIVALVAFIDTYLYYNSALCYVIDNKLRVLDIYKSSKHEFVASIPKLLLTALPRLIAIEES